MYPTPVLLLRCSIFGILRRSPRDFESDRNAVMLIQGEAAETWWGCLNLLLIYYPHA